MRARPIALAFAAAAIVTVAFVLDPWVFRSLSYPGVDTHDWGRLLRTVGSLVFWIPLAAAIWLQERTRGAWVIALVPAMTGAVAELVKMVVRRERPALHDGEYFYRSFAERPFDTHDLGFPSSHVMVAFGGAAVLARKYPRAAPVFYLLALGCGMTRLLTRAHFLSDVAAAAIAGWAIGSWFAGRMLPSPRETA